MDLGLKGKVAIVTGGAKGIGKSEALILAQEGATVVVADLDKKAEDVAEEVRRTGGKAMAVVVDVSKSDSVEQMINAVYDEFGKIDILVNNAGIVGEHIKYDIVDMPQTSWDTMLGVHLGGTFLCTKYAARLMIKQGWGRIINTSSLHAKTGARRGFAAYGAAKAGIDSFTRIAAKELGPYGITVNAVAPGYVKTSILPFSDEQYEFLKGQIPIGRFATGDDMGNCVAFLASDQAEYINGTTIEVNGGRVEFYVK